MALSSLLDHYAQALYRQHSLQPVSTAMLPVELLSRAAHLLIDVFLSESGTTDRSGGVPATAFIPNVSWTKCPMTLGLYDEMSASEQAEVLGFLTFPIHEITHHVDHFTTPFGVLYHSMCCAEYVAMQRFIPEITEDGARFPSEPLASKPDSAFPASQGWDYLKRWVRFFDACRGAPERSVDDSARAKVEVFGTTLTYCRVYNAIESVRCIQTPGYYVRPTTLLEARALIHSLMYIVFLFDRQEPARAALRRYLDSFYPQESCAPDYLFLLDLFSRMFKGVTSFTDLLEKAPVAGIDSWLRLLDGVCWYALQGPSRLDAGDPQAAGPVERFVLATLHLSSRLHRDKQLRSNSVVAVLKEMDEDDAMRNFKCTPISEALERSLAQVKDVRRGCLPNISDRAIRKHFHYIFKAQTYFMRQRLVGGYNSLIGMPENGNVVGSLRGVREVDYLGLDFAQYGYVPAPDVTGWFADREWLLFHYRLGGENETLRVRLRQRFPPCVDGMPQRCRCGALVAGKVPAGVWRYYCRCSHCGHRIRIRPLLREPG